MADQQLWRCPVEGDVEPAMVFEDIPADRFCWVASAEQDDFQDDVEV